MGTPMMPVTKKELLDLVDDLAARGVRQVSLRDGQRAVDLVISLVLKGVGRAGVEVDELGIHHTQPESEQ